ncbi:MAG: tetratricopeptide repeat protein [Verrucomicrobiota bacterium]
MPTDVHASAQLKIAQVLVVQIIPGSGKKVSLENVEELISVIEKTDAFRGARITGKAKRLTIPQGAALIFTSTPDAPVRCAIQISKALHNHPGLRVRMGIHDGPVEDLTDTNEFSTPEGAGFEQALRITEVGDAGHILLTREMAGGLGLYRYWQPYLQHFGEFQLKGQIVSVVNLFTGEAGRQDVPVKLANLPVSDIPADDRVQGNGKRIAIFGAVVLMISIGAFLFTRFPNRTRLDADSEIQSSIPEKSIAVLPFENITGNAETASFTDGVHDEILTQLAKLSDLKVISRTSVLQYKETRTRSLREIGRQLRVAYVMEGSVQHVDNRIRVTAQLIDARSDAHIWAQTYDRVASDIFVIQTEIAKTITEQLKVQLSPQERAALAQTATTDLVADRLFREGLRHLTSGSNPDAKQSILASIPLLEEALQRDPKFLRALSVLVTAHLDLYWQGFDHTEARAEAARRLVERAVATDPNSGETHFCQALYYYRVFRDYDRARAELEQARRTMPNSASIAVILGAMDRRQGRWNEAVQNLNRAIELDPRNFRFQLEAGFTYQAMHRYAEATSLYHRALAIQPRDAFTRTQLAAIPFYETGDIMPLRNEITDILKDDPTAATAIAGAIYNCALAARNTAGATRALQAIRADGLRDDYNNSLWSRDWFVGLAARTFGDENTARNSFEAAREIETKNVREQPDYAPAWSRLGLIEAMLGHKESALSASRKACELVPLTVDAFDGASYRVHQALVYLWTGDRDAALHQLEELVKLPGAVTYGELRLYPQWDALRGDPRFDRIVAGLAKPEGNFKN